MTVALSTEDIFAAIEAVEFDVRLNVVSSQRQFEAVARAQPEFKRLVQALGEHDYGDTVAEALNARCEALIEEPGDTDYSHVHDVALAVYLMALDATDSARTLEWSVELAKLPTGAWCRRVGDCLAGALGFGYALNWTPPSGGPAATPSMHGELTFRVADEPIWRTQGDLQSLLEHLCEYWPTLAYSDGYPLALDARTPLDFAVKSADYLETLSEPRRATAQELLSAFQSAHQLGSCMTADHPLWLLRQGNQTWVASRGSSDQEHAKLLPRLQVFSALRMLGDELALRAAAAGQTELAARWDSALDVDQHTLLSILTGLDASTLASLELPTEEMPSANGDEYEYEWMAAARMLASADLHELIPKVLHTLKDIEARPSALLDAESKRALARLATHSQSKAYEQGYAIARWLRVVLELGDAPVNPRELLRRWGVPVLERALGHSDVDALAVWGRRRGPAIVLNTEAEASEARQRATLAHEIAHLLVDREGALPLAEVLGGNVPKGVEQRARAFAAEFLLPGAVAVAAFGGESERSALEATLHRSAEHYGVSYEIVAWQARNHGALSSETERFLRKKVSQPTNF